MSERQRLRFALLVVATVIGIGIVGYMGIEGIGLLDALYETIITITTVGFAEPAGGLSATGRLFTVVLILVGTGSVFYAAFLALEYFINEMLGGKRRQRLEEKMIAKMEGHTIVCGYGRVGSSLASRLEENDTELVILDIDEERIDAARAGGINAIRGDATDEDVLTSAGLDKAAVIVACVHSDSDNLSIVLSARVRRPKLYVLARASDAAAERRLKMAGADRVVTPQEVGAERLAALVLNSGLTEFVDITAGNTQLELRVEEIKLNPGCELVGKSLAESRVRSRVGTTILAIRHANGTMTSNPSPDVPLAPDDSVVAIGTAEQLEELERLT